MAIPEGLNGMNGKAWARAARERISMTQHDVAVLANLTVGMVKKYESKKYRIQPSERMREMLEHYLAEHRRAVAAIVERHRGEERATLSFSRVSDLPGDLPVVPEKLRTLDHGRPWSDDQFASTRLSSNRDMSR